MTDHVKMSIVAAAALFAAVPSQAYVRISVGAGAGGHSVGKELLGDYGGTLYRVDGIPTSFVAGPVGPNASIHYAGATGSASASANISTGTIRLNMLTGSAAGSYQEKLFFNIAGATAATVTRINMVTTVSANQASLYFNNITMGTQVGGFQLVSDGLTPSFGMQAGLSSYAMSVAGNTRTFRYSYDLVGATPELYAQGFVGVDADPNVYGSGPRTHTPLSVTAVTRMILPANATFSSQSGLAFTGAASIGGVPEPASWAMLLGGFGALGSTLRRRRAGVCATVTA